MKKILPIVKNSELREEYQETIAVFRPEEIVFLDECFFCKYTIDNNPMVGVN